MLDPSTSTTPLTVQEFLETHVPLEEVDKLKTEIKHLKGKLDKQTTINKANAHLATELAKHDPEQWDDRLKAMYQVLFAVIEDAKKDARLRLEHLDYVKAEVEALHAEHLG